MPVSIPPQVQPPAAPPREGAPVEGAKDFGVCMDSRLTGGVTHRIFRLPRWDRYDCVVVVVWVVAGVLVLIGLGVFPSHIEVHLP